MITNTRQPDNPHFSNIRRRIPILLIMSDLQSDILKHICTTLNASYKTLLEGINKDRITILQSVESLIEYRYVEKIRVNPRHKKSRLVFIPTHKGISHAYLTLGVDIKKMIKAKDDEISMYVEFIKEIFKHSQHKQMLEPMFSKLERGYLEIYEDNADKKKELVKECFRIGLLEVAQYRDYNTRVLFNSNSIRWLKKLFSNEELKNLKEILVQTRNNLTSTIERFPR